MIRSIYVCNTAMIQAVVIAKDKEHAHDVVLMEKKVGVPLSSFIKIGDASYNSKDSIILAKECAYQTIKKGQKS